MIVYILLAVSLVGNAVASIMIRNAMIKTESYDKFLTETQSFIIAIINTMKSIDIRGSFQSDDEIGAIFQQMNALVESLDVFLLDPKSESADAPNE